MNTEKNVNYIGMNDNLHKYGSDYIQHIIKKRDSN